MSDADNPAAAPRDVLGKADEFIRRRRAQLGGAALEAPLPATAAEDDIPTLTEIVDNASLPVNPAAPEAAAQKSGRDINVEVARELEAWLDENLPQVVVHVMDGITDKLIQQVHDSARADLLPRLRRALREDADAGED